MERFKGEEQHAMKEMREEYESNAKESANLNDQLQQQVDDLLEEVNKLRAPVLNLEEPEKRDEGPRIEELTTPRASAGVAPKPMSSMSDLAEQARDRLNSVFNTPLGSEATPKPQLPLERKQPSDEQHKAPSNVPPSPTVAQSEPGKPVDTGTGLTGQQIIDLVKSLTSKDADPDKPRTKEAETRKLNDMPAHESYRQWRNHVRDEVKSCSDKPDEAWLWLNEVFDNKTPREQLEAKLQEPGDLATKIHNFKDEKSKKGIQVRGRRVLSMFEDYFRTSEEAGSLYRVEDLLGVTRTGESVEDLRRFLNRWDATIAGMEAPPADSVLRDILLRQIRKCHLMKYDIEAFDEASEKTEQKSYAFLSFLLQNIRDLLDRERLRSTRNRIVEKNFSSHRHKCLFRFARSC
eukprot:s582_g18.t1